MRSPFPRPLPKPRLLLASSWVKGTRYQPQQAGHTGGGSSSRHRAQPVRRGVPARPWARRRSLGGGSGSAESGCGVAPLDSAPPRFSNETRATCARAGGRGPDRAGLVTRVRGRGFVSGAGPDGARFVGAVCWGGIWGSGAGLWQKRPSPELFRVPGQVPGCPLPSLDHEHSAALLSLLHR